MTRISAVIFSALLSFAAADEPRSFTVQYLIISAPKKIALAKRAEVQRRDDLDGAVREFFKEARTGRMKIECFENLHITESWMTNTFNGYEVRYPTEPEQLQGGGNPWGQTATPLSTLELVLRNLTEWQSLGDYFPVPTTFEVKNVGHQLTINSDAVQASKIRFSIADRYTVQTQSESPRYGAGMMHFETIKVVPRFNVIATTHIMDPEPNRWTFVSFHNDPSDNTRSNLHFFRYIAKPRP